MTALPPEIREVMRNGIPCWVVTCSKDGAPNTTAISETFYVDESHVALSHQFFNKTKRNVSESGFASVSLTDIAGASHWLLQLEFDHSETDGPIFDDMEMHIEAIASQTGMSGVFKLRAADVFRVRSWERQRWPSG